MSRTLTILLFFLTLKCLAYVDIHEGQFVDNGKFWKPIGVNLPSNKCDKPFFKSVADYGWNSVRVTFESTNQLRKLGKIASRDGIKLYVVVNKDCDISSLVPFKKEKNIWAWECTNFEQAEKLHEIFPNHLIALTMNPFEDETKIDRAVISPHIDFLSIKLLPFDFKWVSGNNLRLGLKNCYLQSQQLIDKLMMRMQTTVKPIVVSECAYPRDKMFCLPMSSTSSRDSYFSFVINYKHPIFERSLSGVFFQQWELPPTEDNEKHLTSFSLYPGDLSTQELITKAVSNK